MKSKYIAGMVNGDIVLGLEKDKKRLLEALKECSECWPYDSNDLGQERAYVKARNAINSEGE